MITINMPRCAALSVGVTVLGMLFACGGGGQASATSSAPPVTVAPQPTPVTPPLGNGESITSIKVQNLDIAQTNIPFTVGQIFAPGALGASDALVGKLDDGSQLPLQVNIKATHSDGSVRHSIISAVLPKLDASQTRTLSFVRGTGSAPSTVFQSPSSLLDSGFTAGITINLGGVTYTASADSLLRAGKYTHWLSGPLVNEWLASAQLTTTAGVEHPHLTARFAIRSYSGLSKARVDVVLENGWAYEPGPQDFTYNAQILVGGQTAYSKTALTHYHHARWRKTFWWGVAPKVNVKHDTAYLIASKAVPNYDKTIGFSASNLAQLKAQYAKAATEPMDNGFTTRAMGSGGGRPDIGLLPGWTVTYLLTMDADAKQSTLGTADLAGSWPVHYRDKKTDRAISIVDYPYMTILGRPGDTINPTTKLSEAFPACVGACANPNLFDSAHQPSLAYLPYMLTGDYYYLEELQFWNLYSMLQTNPGYRSWAKGLLHKNEVRAQAWTLRGLADAAYLTPDSDSFKKQFETMLADNLDWYNANYTNNSSADNSLAFITEHAIIYASSTGLAPWQDDFFTSAIGHIAELGYSKAQPLLAWKAKFPVSRINGPDFCWIVASNYTLTVRDTSTSPIYSNMGQVYRASMPTALTSLPCGGGAMAANLGLTTGEMVGYAYSYHGYPATMQPALAYSADSGFAGATAAWVTFSKRSIQPDYAISPQFAIVPR